MVEINSETDFVSKSQPFIDLVSFVSRTSRCSNVEKVLETQPEIQAEITSVVGKLGENIKLRRVVHVPSSSTRILGIHSHSAQSLPIWMGRIGSIVSLELTWPGAFSSDSALESDKQQVSSKVRNELTAFANKLAQHLSGFNPTSISEGDECLMRQDFLFGGGKVEQVLSEQAKTIGGSIVVAEMCRWECGEGLTRVQENFAEEVAKQMRA
jgi:elongation factor Ts